MGLARELLSTHKISAIPRSTGKKRTEPGRVLVLGGAGYLGSVLVRELLRRGFAVRVLDALLFGARSLSELRGAINFELIEGDVRESPAVARAMAGCAAVVHLAGIVGDRACEAQEALAMQVNLEATATLAELARVSGIRKFLFASSCSVYGASEKLLDENSPLNPLSIYARTKEQSEKFLLAKANGEFAPTILRLGTLFGLSPRMRFDLVVNLFVAQAASCQRITICNGEQWRPFLHVQDAARAFVACLEAEDSSVAGETFNVGARALNCQIGDLARQVADAVPGTEFCAVQNGDRRNYRVAFDKIRSRLGYRARRDLASGIEEIYESLLSDAKNGCPAGQFVLSGMQQAPFCAQER
jgi:nucleoside-diphosphate-sugar epimerase